MGIVDIYLRNHFGPEFKENENIIAANPRLNLRHLLAKFLFLSLFFFFFFSANRKIAFVHLRLLPLRASYFFSSLKLPSRSPFSRNSFDYADTFVQFRHGRIYNEREENVVATILFFAIDPTTRLSAKIITNGEREDPS